MRFLTLELRRMRKRHWVTLYEVFKLKKSYQNLRFIIGKLFLLVCLTIFIAITNLATRNQKSNELDFFIKNDKNTKCILFFHSRTIVFVSWFFAIGIIHYNYRYSTSGNFCDCMYLAMKLLQWA